MTFTSNETTKKAVEEFRRFDADTQLALLWFGYLDLKDQLSPRPVDSVERPAQALYDQIQALSPEEQLQAQRDIVVNAENSITRTYRSLSSSGQIEVWLLLAQGMENGSIIAPGSDYQLPQNTQSFVEKIKQLDFEERINFTRSAVYSMGA